MSQYCPIVKRNVLYLECLECEDKVCRNPNNNEEKQNIILEKPKEKEESDT